jgi:hypothetical protein
MDDLVEAARPVVARVLRRRFHGVSLRPSDDRRENERAIDCYQQAMVELCAKFRRVIDGTDPPILSLPDYAARVAHNVVNEELRPPNWTRLANRIRRVMSKEAAFEVWDDVEHGRVAGYAGWRARRQASGSLSELRRTAGSLRSDSVLATHWENIDGPHWRTLLERVFDAAGGPLRLSTVVLFLADILDVASEVPWEDDGMDGEAGAPRDPESPAPRAEDQVVLKEQLRHLWECARQLRREWRLALLMNPPSMADPRREVPEAGVGASGSRPRTSGRGTSRGELDVFPAQGVASIQEIGEALELTGADYHRIFEAIGVGEDAKTLSGPAAFYRLWAYLPLPDSLIGQLVGKTGMQVLALRRLAIREVAGCMADRAGARQVISRPDGRL